MFTKLKWILGILMVFVLILGTNLIDRDSFSRMRDSVVTIYEDRLIASDIIFDVSQILHEKELALAIGDTSQYSSTISEQTFELQTLIDRYDHTHLTDDEQVVWRRVKSSISTLLETEESLVSSKFEKPNAARNQINKIQEHLETLAKIQIVEGERQKNISEDVIDTVELFTHIEIYMLVFLALAVQVIILARMK
ncbi:MCP four helix bundle domain-containing protein [Phaeocystidibacter luteus]|uniref:Chemotaxis protein n=1 Tax=Phaeocystidibacter luteus TaxID=911197 RepID=A0A6N6RDS2_9FLAO|nr:MCP four helix bundle domain-containing protein [Phaeocystidibacter luteus]KAB2804303.1 chemotaxis protein [Phaeocystidibacter luteus]